jgi:hypothetical protein
MKRSSAVKKKTNAEIAETEHRGHGEIWFQAFE